MANASAVIIGAGMSGLAAGIRLAQFGSDVVILERHYLWGGLNSFYKLGGRRFDANMTTITLNANQQERGFVRANEWVDGASDLRINWHDTANGQEAMDAALESSFELVLTDIVMPDIEGIELIAHMQKGDPDLPIIVMTGHDRYTPIIDALQVNEILFKPFSMEEVSFAVKKAFS